MNSTPAWSPDGTALAFLSGAVTGPAGSSTDVLAVLPESGLQRTVSVNLQLSRPAGLNWVDESTLLAHDFSGDTPGGVFAVNTLSGASRPLFGSRKEPGNPTASNGRVAYTLRMSSGLMHVVRLDLTAGTESEVKVVTN